MFDDNFLNHLTVSQQMNPGLLKNCYVQNIHLQIIYI